MHVYIVQCATDIATAICIRPSASAPPRGRNATVSGTAIVNQSLLAQLWIPRNCVPRAGTPRARSVGLRMRPSMEHVSH